MALLIDGVRALHEASEALYSVYNITTRGYLLEAQTGVAANPDANAYAATPYWVIRRVFRHLPPQCLCGSFIDYGCGHGRVAIMAARLPFRHVIGVELSGKLYRRAQENLNTSRASRRCQVAFLQADAACFPVPDDVSAVFFYNRACVVDTTRKNGPNRSGRRGGWRELWRRGRTPPPGLPGAASPAARGQADQEPCPARRSLFFGLLGRRGN
jgi:SAM-dependent methyltransferase